VGTDSSGRRSPDKGRTLPVTRLDRGPPTFSAAVRQPGGGELTWDIVLRRMVSLAHVPSRLRTCSPSGAVFRTKESRPTIKRCRPLVKAELQKLPPLVARRSETRDRLSGGRSCRGRTRGSACGPSRLPRGCSRNGARRERTLRDRRSRRVLSDLSLQRHVFQMPPEEQSLSVVIRPGTRLR
jgi:hypothetical protein